MSDISIEFPWWFSLFVALGLAFWPLTVLAAAVAVLCWFRRSRFVVSVTALVLLIWLVSASVNVYAWADRQRTSAFEAAELQSRQRTLNEPGRIAGMTLPAKTVVTRRYGEGPDRIEALDLVMAADIRGIPLIGHVEFDGANRIHGAVTLARDAPIGGILCSAKDDVIILNGALSTCTLTRSRVVHGIPCSGKLDVTVGVSCTLATTYQRYGVAWPPKTTIDDSPLEGKTWFTIGPVAPSLRSRGKALPEKSVVEYTHGRISSINPAQP